MGGGGGGGGGGTVILSLVCEITLFQQPSFNPAHIPWRDGRRKKGWWESDVVWVSRWNGRATSHALTPGDVVALQYVSRCDASDYS